VLDQLANEGRLVGNVIAAALHGDWQGVKDSWAQFKADTTKTLQSTMDEAVKIAAKGRADIDKVIGTNLAEFKPQTAIAAKEGGERSEGKATKPDASQDRVSVWAAELKAAQDDFAMKNGLKKQELSEDAAFWEKKLALTESGSDLQKKVYVKFMDAKLAMMRQDVERGRALSEEQVNESEKAALDALALLRAEADQRLQLGLITKAEMIAIERDLENQKLSIAQQAQQARIGMVENDPNHSPAALEREKDKLLEIERKYQLAVTQLRTKAAVEDAANFTQFSRSLESGFASVIQRFMQGTLTIKGFFVGMGQAILTSMTQVFAEIAAKWIIKEATLTAATAAGTAARMGLEVTAAAQSVLLWAATAIKNIMTSAWEAMAGAYKAIVGIPYVGPFLAPVAAGTAFAAVAGFASNIASASRGYDIPAGVNPLTQLHEREMVLPQRQADVIRGMADNGGGAATTIHLHITAFDSKDVRRVLMDNTGPLAEALKKAGRNFAFSGA
jgi:hypothetical protein